MNLLKYENEAEQKVKLQSIMDNLGMEALSQINRKLYDSEMRTKGITKITKIGMVFCGKQLKLYTE